MKKRVTYILLLVFAAILCLIGCEERFDLNKLPSPTQADTLGVTSYVEVFPPWGGFATPTAIMVGGDQLIYVVDHDDNQVVMMDASGAILQRDSTILHPISIAQNSKLDLYIGGEAIAQNGTDTIGAIYRIFVVRFDTIYVSRIDTVISPFGDTTFVPVYRDTSYFYNHDLKQAHKQVVWQEPAHPERRFPGIGILPGNSYLVARVGPDNSSFVDPDTRVLLFNGGDTLVTPVPDLVTRPSGGTAITDIRNLTGILVVPSSRDFILTQSSEQVAYGAIWMSYFKNPDFQGWLPKYDPAKVEQRGVDFIRPYRYRHATGAAFDRRRREVFIVDSELDSVVKFDRSGQFRSESFGRYKTTSDQFPGLNHPGGISFSNDCTLYIADTGNRVIRRFKLSTQTQCN
ncbi:MAG: hypothetical protein HYR76_04745 [Ignavibacteria bacterium]|nr:hypothetical protein [Ignavibacteria bacterium]